MDKQIYCINVDWFQVSCTRDYKQALSEGMYVYGTATTDNGREICYKLTQPREFNALFGNCLSVELHGFRLATIYCEPRPSSIPRNLCLIKMSNPVLYSRRWQWYLADIMAALRWKYKSISRVDVACDFNYFSGGLDPREFIRRYMNSGAWCPEQVSYYRVGGNKYSIIGKKRAQSIEVKNNSVGGCVHDVQYLRFGQRISGVTTYLYNKSLELSEQKNKQYIADYWQKVGLLNTPEVPVFRLEISIGNKASSVKVKRTDDQLNEFREAEGLRKHVLDKWSVRSLAFDDFGTQEMVERVFWAYASHYFRFKIVGPQHTPTHWQDCVLFDASFAVSMKPYRITFPLDSGRAEEQAAKRLEMLLYSADSLSVEERISLDSAIMSLKRLAGLKQTTFSPEVLDKLQNGLTKGWSWEEFQRRRIIPYPVLQRLREYVENAAVRELEYLKSDPQVMRAITELDCTYEMLGEDIKYLPQ